MDSRALMGVVQLLTTRPSCDHIAQHLVLNLMPDHRARAAVISLFGHDGLLHAVGSFGVPPTLLESFATLSLWDTSPMTDAVRAGEPLIVSSREELTDRYPWLDSEMTTSDSIVVWPLSLPGERVGAVQIFLSGSPSIDMLHAELNGVSAVVALYLSMLFGDMGRASHAMSAPAGDRPEGPQVGINPLAERAGGWTVPPAEVQPTDRPDLTERQARILELLAKGMTNPQISRQVGYSESTVRQETMAIYRYFGVSGRHEAVRMAGLRGMLHGSKATV
jgi:DNA-binding CsgD family transcriptional regulator